MYTSYWTKKKITFNARYVRCPIIRVKIDWWRWVFFCVPLLRLKNNNCNKRQKHTQKSVHNNKKTLQSLFTYQCFVSYCILLSSPQGRHGRATGHQPGADWPKQKPQEADQINDENKQFYQWVTYAYCYENKNSLYLLLLFILSLNYFSLICWI